MIIAQIVAESEEFRDAFCAECDAMQCTSGARDSLGVPLDPDEVTCPADLEPGAPGCVKGFIFAELMDRLREAEACLR